MEVRRYFDRNWRACEQEVASFVRIYLATDDGVLRKITTKKLPPKDQHSLARFIIETHGDLPGHPFRGNQWKDGFGNEDKERIPPGDPRRDANFKKWFGDSKITNPDGSPKVVYHGGSTDENYDPFSSFEDIEDKGDHPNWLSQIGNWFTDGPATAAHFGDAEPGPTGQSGKAIYPVFLKIENPYVRSTYAQLEADLEEFKDENAEDEGLDPSVHGFRAHLMKYGYDGIVISRSTTDTDEVRSDFVPFTPEQIKSATGNRGTFSPKDKRITHGDLPGHEFRGNQWTGGKGGAGKEKAPKDDVLEGATYSKTSRMTVAEAVRGVPDPHDAPSQEQLLASARAKLGKAMTLGPETGTLADRLADDTLAALPRLAITEGKLASSSVSFMQGGFDVPLSALNDLTVEEWGAVLDNETMLDDAVHETARLWAMQGMEYPAQSNNIELHDPTTPGGNWTITKNGKVSGEFAGKDDADAFLQEMLALNDTGSRRFDYDDLAKVGAALAFGFDVGSGPSENAAKYFSEHEQWKVNAVAAILQREYLDTQKEIDQIGGLPEILRPPEDANKTDTSTLDEEDIEYDKDKAIQDFYESDEHDSLYMDAQNEWVKDQEKHFTPSIVDFVGYAHDKIEYQLRSFGVSSANQDGGYQPPLRRASVDFANDPSMAVDDWKDTTDLPDDEAETDEIQNGAIYSGTDVPPIEWRFNGRSDPDLIRVLGSLEKQEGKAGPTLFGDEPSDLLVHGEQRLARFEELSAANWARINENRAKDGDDPIEVTKEMIHGNALVMALDAEGITTETAWNLRDLKTFTDKGEVAVKMQGWAPRRIIAARMFAKDEKSLWAYQKEVGPQKLKAENVARGLGFAAIKDDWREKISDNFEMDPTDESQAFDEWFEAHKSEYVEESSKKKIKDMPPFYVDGKPITPAPAPGPIKIDTLTTYRGITADSKSSAFRRNAAEAWSTKRGAASHFGSNIIEYHPSKEEILVARGMKHWKQVHEGNWSRAEYEVILLPSKPNWKRKKAA